MKFIVSQILIPTGLSRDVVLTTREVTARSKEEAIGKFVNKIKFPKKFATHIRLNILVQSYKELKKIK